MFSGNQWSHWSHVKKKGQQLTSILVYIIFGKNDLKIYALNSHAFTSLLYKIRK